MINRFNLNITRILEATSLYSLGVPIATIARIFQVNKVTMWKKLKRYERLGLFKIKSKSESVLTTLAKSHTTPKGEGFSRVKEWVDEFGREGLIDILTIFLLTDASATYKTKTIRFCCSDTIFLQIFVDLLKELDLKPREMLDKRNNLKIIFARNNSVKTILEEVYKRTPTTKHQPQKGKENWENYLKCEQPTLRFLYNKPPNLIELCFRIAVSLEGCVMACKTKNRITRPQINFTCFHPKLLKQWQKVSEIIGINMKPIKNNLRTRSLKSIKRFIETGGFIDGIENCSKSRHFAGVEKNRRMADLFLYYYREKRRK